jgi:hypothetical protein
VSYQVHNIVSWLKIKPFLPKWGSRVFIYSLLAVQPFWIAEAWSNFEYFNGLGSDANIRTRPWEALVRDPWWIFTTFKLIDAIKKTYGFKLLALVKINSRFGVMLACMFISIAFLLTDVVVSAARLTASSGINPYWRFALVFKCASDTIFLDDFKSVLDAIVARKSSRDGTIPRSGIGGRKCSIRDGHDLVECGPVAQIPFTESTSRPPKYLGPFGPHSPNRPVPKIHIQKETTVSHDPHKPSHDSCHSDTPILTEPAPAVYKHSRGSGSFGSLTIFRPDFEG